MTDTVIVTVNDVPDVRIINPITTFSVSSDPVLLSATPGVRENGIGIFSGPGVTPNGDATEYYFNPEIAGTTFNTGTNVPHNIIYTYVNTNSVPSCMDIDTIRFTIYETDNPVDGLLDSYCRSSDITSDETTRIANRLIDRMRGRTEEKGFGDDEAQLLAPNTVTGVSGGIDQLISPGFTFHSYTGPGVRERMGKFLF